MRNKQIQTIISVFTILISMASSAADATAVSTGTASNTSKAIYGTDSRTDYYNMTSTWQKTARSTVALISRSKISRYGSDKVSIQTKDYGWDNDLCSEERFFSQKTAAFCSGALVGPDLVLTAGHCIEDLVDCDNTNFVFDFHHENSYSNPTTIAASKVYGCGKIISQTKTSTNDYALIQLDRPVLDRGNLSVASTGYYMSEGTKLAVIGHPWGLPTKMAEGTVTNDSPFYYFEATLDTFSGNSGSPVFNKSSGLIEGILVRGQEDFVEDKTRGCFKSAVYSDSSTDAEEVTRVNQVASKIKSHNNNATAAIRCSISAPSQAVLYGASFKTSWSVDGHIPKGGTVSYYGYINGNLAFNKYVNAFDSETETNNNQYYNQNIERGMIVRDPLGNTLCQAGPVIFVQNGLLSSKLTPVGVYITHLYSSILGRQPDDSGFGYWYDQAAQRKVTCSQIPASFLSSPEFQQRNRTLDTRSFVVAMYQLVFKREPDAAGLEFWVNALLSGQNTRQGIVDAFLSSPEFNTQCASYGLGGAGSFTMQVPVENLPDGLEARKATPVGSYINHLYVSILGRQPEDGGFTFWYDLAVQRKVSCSQLPASFLSSPEFQQRNRTLDRTGFLTALYQLVFKREPDASGLQFWLNALNSGQNTRQGVADAFLASPEFNNQCLSYGLDGAGQFTMQLPIENLP